MKINSYPKSGVVENTLRKIRRGLLINLLGRTLLRLTVVAAGAMLVFLALEKLYYIPGVWRLVLLIIAALALAAVAVQALWSAWRKYGSLRLVARLCDFCLPEMKNRLESSLEFIRGGFDKRDIYSQELTEAAVAQTAGKVSLPGFRERVLSLALAPQVRARRIEFGLALGSGLLLLLTGLADPLLLERAYRGFGNPLELIELERNFRIFVEPGDTTLLRGDTLVITAAGSIRRPARMRLEYWQTGKIRELRQMPYTSDQSQHRLNLGAVENDLSYVVSQSGTVTDTFRVRVTNNPFITELRLRYEYPAYTGMPPYETARDKAIQGLRGTKVIMEGRASNELAAVSLILGGDSLRPLVVHDERGFSDTLILMSNSQYSLRLEDRWGLFNTDSLVYPISVSQDESPRVVLLFPEKETKLGEVMQQTLMYETADDYGISRMRLNYRKMTISGRESEQQSMLLRLPEKGVSHFLDRYDWNLTPQKLLPGESVVYSLTVWDNDRVSGPKSSSTEEFTLRFPTLQEIFQQGEKEQQEIASNLEELGRQGQKTLEQVQKMQESLERNRQMDWQDKQRLGEAIERQKEIAAQVGKLAEKLKQSVDQLQRGESMSSELLEKLSQVQKLMEEVATDEMKELMARIQSSMDNIDPQELARDVERLKFSQEKFLEKLDKTLSVLEKIKIEQQMDFLVKRTRELARAAEALADSSAARAGEEGVREDSMSARRDGDNTGDKVNTPGDSTLSGESSQSRQDGETGEENMAEREAEREQESALTPLEKELLEKSNPEALEQIGQLTEDVFERMEKTAGNLEKSGERELAQNLEKEAAEANREYFNEAWKDASGKMESGRRDEASKKEREAGRKMGEMNRRMQEYSEKLKEKWKNEVSEAMRRAFDDLDYLSRRQEEIAEAVKIEPDINHPDVLKLAAEQQEVVQGLSSVQRGLSDAARDNFFISSRLLDIVDAAVVRGESSTGQLSAEQRNREQAADIASGVLAAINVGMLSLLDQQQSMEQSSSGVGMDQMMKNLEQLAQRQEQLNRQMREQMSNGQGGEQPMPGSGMQPSSGEMMEMLRQMAAEQNAIREELSRMSGQAGQGEETGRLESALEGMAQEAEEVVKDLLERGVKPETFERQRRLLNRLLSAKNSLQKRDSQDNERKSETAKQYTPQPPPSLPRGLLESAGGENELKLLLEKWKGAYPESYEALIRSYYERLRTRESQPLPESER